MTIRMNEEESSKSHLPPETRSNQGTMSSNVSDEGCPVIESGAVCGETKTLSIIREFREIYDNCVQNMEQCSSDSTTLKKLEPFRKLVDNLWEQNAMLVETVQELEHEATCRVAMLQERLNQSNEKDLQSVLQQKENEVTDLLKEISEKDELLKKYFAQIDELRKDMDARNKKYKCLLKYLKEAASKCNSELPNDLVEEDGYNECSDEGLVEAANALLQEIKCQRAEVVNQLEETESHLKSVTNEKDNILLEKNDIGNKLEYLSVENRRLVKEIADLRTLKHQNEDLVQTVKSFKTENEHLAGKVNVLQENLKELDNNFKETRWALTAEVAEKHDQILELRRCVSALEEQLRQADMQTHFKDDIIKEMRKELKSSKKTERRGLYDVVTELKSKPICNKNESAMSSTSDFDLDGCESSRELCDPSRESWDSHLSPQVKLESLKQDLKQRIEQIQTQEGITKELEEELQKTRQDLLHLQEKYDKSDNFKDEAKPEVNLQRLRSLLISTSDKLENALSKISEENICGITMSQSFVEEELQNVRTVKEDLKLNRQRSKIQFQEKISSPSDCLDKAKMEINSLRRTIVDLKGKQGDCNLIHVQDLDCFRTRAVTGVAALEEMKDQIDVLQKIVKKYYVEIPNECEKCQIEECEDKIEKLQAEFDEVIDYLGSFIEKINRTSGCHKMENLECKDLRNQLKEKECEIKRLECLLCDKNSATNEICRLKEEQDKLKKIINEREASAEQLRGTIQEMEKQLEIKRSQVVEHDKEINEREEDISKLREGIQNFRERLKNMQIDIADSLKHKEVMKVSSSSSTLSNLSQELQELWGILDKSKEAIPCAMEKNKEENDRMKEQLKSIEKYNSNKDETIRLLQDTLKLREGQIEELNCKVLKAEQQLAKLCQEMDEKCRLIANLQESARKCKQFEMKIKDEHIDALQVELIELDGKYKKAAKELLEKDQNMESFQDEILILQSRNFALEQENEMMEPKLGTIQKNCQLYEKTVKQLQRELDTRECEIESLYEKVKQLEEELEQELRNCEQRAIEDENHISRLNETIQKLQEQLHCAQQGYEMVVADTEHILMKERNMASEQQHECELKKVEMIHTICRLQSEIKILRKQQFDNSLHEEFNSKISYIENIMKQSESKQNTYDQRLCDLQLLLNETLSDHEKENKKLMEKLCNEQSENLKRKEYIQRFREQIECLKCENLELKAEVEARHKQMMALESLECSDFSEMDELIRALKIQKCELKNLCSNLREELEKERETEKMLETKIEDLNDALRCKTQEFNQLSRNYECVLMKLRETFKKLKVAEERLSDKLKSKMGEIAEVEHEKDCFEALLDGKNAECSEYIEQYQNLKAQFDQLKSDNCSSLANKDCEIKHLKCEINRLEQDLHIIEENYKMVKEDLCKNQNELLRSVQREADVQKEFTEKEKELCDELKEALAEKNELLTSMDNLQKQLEAMCLDLGCKEQANKKLKEELDKLQEQMEGRKSRASPGESEKIINDLKEEIKKLNNKLKIIEKKKANYEKLYNDGNLENAELIDLKEHLESEICRLQSQNMMLKEKMNSISKACEKENQEKKRFCARIKDLTSKIKKLETLVIPQLEQELLSKDETIDVIRMELREANISNERMRNEAVKIVQSTKKYLANQKCVNDSIKSRMGSSEKKSFYGSESTDLDNQLKEVTRMNEFLLCELQNPKHRDDYDLQPRSFSPTPWGCSNVERDNSPDYYVESGFQSMQPSPTNLAYDFKEFTTELRKASTQYNSLKSYMCADTE